MTEEIKQILKSNGDQIDLIAKKVLEHDDQLQSIKEEMATKDDIRGLSDSLDTLVGLAKKRDQEVTMISHGMKRHQHGIQNLEDDVKKMKPALGIS